MYGAFAASAFQTRFAYRSQVWAGLFGQLILVFARVAIWRSVYGDAGTVGGITLADMITYALIGGTLLAAWPYHELLNSVSMSLKTGDVAVYLLQPLRYPLYLFAGACGDLAFRLLTVVVPTVVIVAAVYGMKLPASLFDGVMFAVFWVLSFVLLFLMACACGLIAFWLMTAFSLDWMLGGLIAILSGTFIPLWFFPPAVAAAIAKLPFAWIAYYPTAIYLGKLDPGAAWTALALGLAWAAALAVAVALLWLRAARRIVVQGG